MLDRIEETVQREEQFASDAAHELRTPLAILRTRLETTLLKERSPQEYAQSYEAMLPELERLTLTVESLLRSARGAPAPAEPVDIEPVIMETVARYQPLFANKRVRLDLDTRPTIAEIL